MTRTRLPAPGSSRPLTDPAEAGRVAATFKALADPVRLLLFCSLAERSEQVCVCDLPDLGVSQPTVSHHLRRLREAGLVDCERRGTWVYYWTTSAGQAVAAAVTAARRATPAR